MYERKLFIEFCIADEQTVQFANDNWQELLRVGVPQTRKYWTRIVLDIINQALKAVPFDVFINV